MSASVSPSKAQQLIDKLDEAADSLEEASKTNKSDKDKEKLEDALEQLATTRSLLTMIKTQDKFQIEKIIAQLPAVEAPLQKLVTELKGKPPSIRRISNAIQELDGETKNLKSLLPGLYVEAEFNTQDKGSSLMVNGPVVKKSGEDLVAGGTFISRRNQTSGGVQINSFVEADLGKWMALSPEKDH